jgi:hypothetical protein
MLNRVRRPGATGSEGEKATSSLRSAQPAQRFPFDAQTLAAVRNRRPASNLALGIIVGRGAFFKRPPRPLADSNALALCREFSHAEARIRPQTRITKHSELPVGEFLAGMATPRR